MTACIVVSSAIASSRASAKKWNRMLEGWGIEKKHKIFKKDLFKHPWKKGSSGMRLPETLTIRSTINNVTNGHQLAWCIVHGLAMGPYRCVGWYVCVCTCMRAVYLHGRRCVASAPRVRDSPTRAVAWYASPVLPPRITRIRYVRLTDGWH